MENKPLKISLRMATIMGVFLPLAETVRRSNQIVDLARFLSWFDDYILGAILLIAVYLVKKKINNSISFLIAAWGFVSGALFLSFLGQFEYYRTTTGDPGIFSTSFVAIAKGLILGYMLLGLYMAIRSNSYK
ncbi:hypothetical protein DSM107010_63070 [Chroococcidiopsis cubana SAG 39.79]|uniref:Uncharacterized protein n=2 Tax=Chroococcidiopsis TaxID=54298 RepID=A0AB37U9Y9_9CYAN|nr:hypothetical protein [Chroococcidiopsis cubana]RUT02331.1 hypothetical protein DSM107010_63070 [Chroococcidiopsis cubana SAG 39.79]